MATGNQSSHKWIAWIDSRLEKINWLTCEKFGAMAPGLDLSHLPLAQQKVEKRSVRSDEV